MTTSNKYNNTASVQNVHNTSEKYPLDIYKLSKGFSQLWESHKNTTSEYLIILWETIFKSINKSYYINVSNLSKDFIVIPAPTGSGKTQCFRFYAAELSKMEFEEGERPGMLIVTTFIDEINEAVEQINELAGREVAAAYHSETRFKLEQEEYLLNDYQIVVISHEYYIRNHYVSAVNNDIYQQVSTYKDKPRPIIVIDESIKLIQNIGIDRKTINSIDSNIDSLYKNGSTELKDERSLVNYIHSNFEKLFGTRGKAELIGDKSAFLKKTSEELGFSIAELRQLFKLKKLSEELDGDKLFEINKAVSYSKKKDFARDVTDFHHLLDDALYRYDGKNGVTYRTSELETPDSSFVVLDATANVDKFYDNFSPAFIRQVPPVKTYEQVTINLLQTKVPLGKDMLKRNPQIHWDNISFHLLPSSANSDNTVVFVHKDLKKSVERWSGDTCKMDNFGNLVGVNRYQDYTNVMIYGIHYKPDYVYYDNLYQSTKDEKVFSKDSKYNIQELKYSNVSTYIIQAINRITCRKIVNGKAPQANITLLLPNNKKLSEVIIESIKSEMKGIVINKKDTPLEFDIKKDKAKPPVGVDTKFINCIDSSLNEIKLSDLCKQAGVATNKVRERIINYLTKPEHSNTYLLTEVQKLGYRAEKKGQWYLIKHSAG